MRELDSSSSWESRKSRVQSYLYEKNKDPHSFVLDKYLRNVGNGDKNKANVMKSKDLE